MNRKAGRREGFVFGGTPSARTRRDAGTTCSGGVAARGGCRRWRDERRQARLIDWATLLVRVHDVDALACPCGGRLRFIELATDRKRAREILGRLGLPIDSPEPRPAAAIRSLDDLPPPDW